MKNNNNHPFQRFVNKQQFHYCTERSISAPNERELNNQSGPLYPPSDPAIQSQYHAG